MTTNNESTPVPATTGNEGKTKISEEHSITDQHTPATRHAAAVLDRLSAQLEEMGRTLGWVRAQLDRQGVGA